MTIHGKQLLHEFKNQYQDSQSQLESWEACVKDEKWQTPLELKGRYPKARLLGNNNVIFNIGWNRYRMWTKVDYKNQIVFIKKIGTHKDYDGWNIN